jgi:hypothetical protein
VKASEYELIRKAERLVPGIDPLNLHFPEDIHWTHRDCLGALRGSLVENCLRHKPNKGGIVVFDLASSQVRHDLLVHTSTFLNSALM